jgi:hypothetical protein
MRKLDKNDLAYLLDFSLKDYAIELLNNSDNIFNNYTEKLENIRDFKSMFPNMNYKKSMQELIKSYLEENEELAILTGDLEETIYALKHLENYELHEDIIHELLQINNDINIDNIEGKYEFEQTLNQLINVLNNNKIVVRELVY